MVGDNLPEMTLEELFATAEFRVVNSAALEPYYNIIFSDWNDGETSEQHLKWVIQARESTILEAISNRQHDIADSKQSYQENDEW